MNNQRFAVGVLVGGVALGFVSLTSPSVRDFVDGFLGIPLETATSTSEVMELRADLAAPALGTPLQSAEFDEFFQGVVFHSRSQYAEAVPIIGKYAMLGDGQAQLMIGGMYAFGQGLPIDREEALRWLALAAAQGNQTASTLAATIKAHPKWERGAAELAAATVVTTHWEQSATASGLAHSGSSVPAREYDVPTASSIDAYAASRAAYADGLASIRDSSSSASSMGARGSIEQAYGSESASRRYSGAQVGLPEIGNSSPIVLNRAGPGTYSDGSGDIYTQAGPHGVVNTRTGEFSPTN